jgi:hypothetical protein
MSKVKLEARLEARLDCGDDICYLLAPSRGKSRAPSLLFGLGSRVSMEIID